MSNKVTSHSSLQSFNRIFVLLNPEQIIQMTETETFAPLHMLIMCSTIHYVCSQLNGENPEKPERFNENVAEHLRKMDAKSIQDIYKVVKEKLLKMVKNTDETKGTSQNADDQDVVEFDEEPDEEELIVIDNHFLAMGIANTAMEHKFKVTPRAFNMVTRAVTLSDYEKRQNHWNLHVFQTFVNLNLLQKLPDGEYRFVRPRKTRDGAPSCSSKEPPAPTDRNNVPSTNNLAEQHMEQPEQYQMEQQQEQQTDYEVEHQEESQEERQEQPLNINLKLSPETVERIEKERQKNEQRRLRDQHNQPQPDTEIPQQHTLELMNQLNAVPQIAPPQVQMPMLNRFPHPFDMMPNYPSFAAPNIFQQPIAAGNGFAPQQPPSQQELLNHWMSSHIAQYGYNYLQRGPNIPTQQHYVNDALRRSFSNQFHGFSAPQQWSNVLGNMPSDAQPSSGGQEGSGASHQSSSSAAPLPAKTLGGRKRQPFQQLSQNNQVPVPRGIQIDKSVIGEGSRMEAVLKSKQQNVSNSKENGTPQKKRKYTRKPKVCPNAEPMQTNVVGPVTTPLTVPETTPVTVPVPNTVNATVSDEKYVYITDDEDLSFDESYEIKGYNDKEPPFFFMGPFQKNAFKYLRKAARILIRKENISDKSGVLDSE